MASYRSLVTVLALVGCISPAWGQQPDLPEGNGRITGVVVAADNGAPVKRATVMIVGVASAPVPRTAVDAPRDARPTATLTVIGGNMPGRATKQTDDAGRFELTGLAVGQYSIMVSPQGGFVAPRTPQRVLLKEGESPAITIKLERTGAITGRILDESGDPLPRARVTALRAERGARPRNTGPGGMTDDLGQYRLFDLAPGEYYVSAAGQPGFTSGPVGSLGFATTFYPGTAVVGDAQRVTVKSGQDSPGVDFGLVRVPMGTITGTVRDASGQLLTYDPRGGARPMSVNIMLGASEGDGSMSSRGGSVRPDGTFEIGNIAPGNYTLFATAMSGQGPAGPREGAVLPVTVNGDEQRIDLRLNKGATISGRVVIEGTPPTPPTGITPDPSMSRPRISVRAVPGATSFGMLPQPVQPGDDGAFELTGVRGQVLLTTNPMGAAVLKSITYSGTDLMTRPLDLKGTERLGNVLVTMTYETGRIAGTVTKDGTTPLPGAWVVVFPDEPELWYLGSPSVMVTRSMDEMPAGMTPPPGALARRGPGTFSSRPLLPGRYYVAAVEADAPSFSPPQTREEYEKLRPHATTVTVTAGSTANVQLRVRNDE